MWRRLYRILHEYFGIGIDGWTDSGTHFVAIYDSFMNISGEVKQPLLACSPMGNELSQSGQQFVDFLDSTLELYGKSLDGVVYLVSCSYTSRRERGETA